MNNYRWLDDEDETYRWHYKKDVVDDAAIIIIKKLARHFKLGTAYIKFRGNNQSAGINYHTARDTNGKKIGFSFHIKISHNPNLLLIAHELTHPLGKIIYERDIRHGSKQWKRTLAKIIVYGDKKAWWWIEIEKRLNKPKPKRPKRKSIPEKIDRERQKIKRYERRLKLYNTKIKKARKRLASLLRYQSKQNGGD